MLTYFDQRERERERESICLVQVTRESQPARDDRRIESVFVGFVRLRTVHVFVSWDSQMTQSNYTQQILTYERFKRVLFIRTRQNQQILGVIPFVKLQNDT